MNSQSPDELLIIRPEWPAPSSVCSAISTRCGGLSQPPFQGLNLGTHVNDDPEAVRGNRQLLAQTLALPSPPLWLQQVHGRTVWHADETSQPRHADAIIARKKHQVCAILTADCLPLLLCDQKAREIAAIHAGWRGMAQGVIQHTLQQMNTPAQQLLAYLGPAIGPQAYEVDEPVYRAFVETTGACSTAFSPSRPGHWYLDLYAAARVILRQCGVTAIYGGQFCTASDEQRFFSHRRDGNTGRMASLIWINQAQTPSQAQA